MRSTAGIPGKMRIGIFAALLSVAFLALLQASALGFTLNVVDGNGTPLPVGYRWQVEEDTTHPVTPGKPDNTSLSVSIHRSYAPVVANGNQGNLSLLNDPKIIDPAKRYVISVLPDSGFALGGANIAAGQTNVRVVCQGHPLPTAQISVFVFSDTAPINSAPDLSEPGFEGFKILVFEQAGQVTVDAFGNNLGTTYLQNPDGTFQLDANGAPIVDVPGEGIFTDNTGHALIKNLYPKKYGIRAAPPLDGKTWIQTTTLEGTPGIDAWVRANEPPLFNEAGFFSDHVFIGFINPVDNASWRPLGTITPFAPVDNTVYNEQYGTIHGFAMQAHSTRPPPLTVINVGAPLKHAWVGMTNLNNVDELIYAQPCNDNTGEFTIPNVPPGTYQLAFWDQDPFMDAIITFLTIVVPPFDNTTPFVPGVAQGGPSTVALDNVPIAMWFGTFKGTVFNDVNRNGYRDTDPVTGQFTEAGISNQAINIRFRDGSIFQSTVTDDAGNYELIEVFPFGFWLVAEVDYAEYEPTGATIWVDAGGTLPANQNPPIPADPRDLNKRYNDVLNPQPQPDNGGNLYRIESGPFPVLLEGMNLFADQIQIIDWGKTAYAPGKNGGIAGIIFNGTTRAENDPTLAVGEPWDVGIPRAVVNLYADANNDGVIDDVNGDGVITLADVDNHPFNWAPRYQSLDDGSPNPAWTGKPGPEDIDRNGNGVFDAGDAIQIATADSWDDHWPTGCVKADNTAGPIEPYVDCAEMLIYWNQVRPVVFDGGYIFLSYFPGGVGSGSTEVDGLPPGTYIVEAVPPPGYQVQKEEDKNVDFGDPYVPSTRGLATPAPSTTPPCVGDPHVVPPELSLFPGVPAEFAGQTRPLCDKKQVRLAEGTNGAADFHMFTEVPKAGRFVGLVTNDISSTFSLLVNGAPNPRRGDKLAPSWMPVSFQDWQGQEIARVYTDQFGEFNVLLPSTYTINPPLPSGVGEGMVQVVLNSPGPMESPPGSGHFIRDPFYNPAYSVFSLTFDLQPGKTTYLDTPVLPIAAFTASLGRLDCEFPDGTPVISQVDGPGGGPHVDRAGQIIRLVSVGSVEFAFTDNTGGETLVTRDFGFGDNTGLITVGGLPLNIIAWTSTAVTARIPAGITTGQLMLTRGDNGLSTVMGITLHVGGRVRRVALGEKIQNVIDTAVSGDLILVPPGVYQETLIMWKPVKLQGYGAFSTVIEGSNFDLAAQAAWQTKVQALLDAGLIDHIPGDNFNFLNNRGAGITVFAKEGAFTAADPARIDGFLVTGTVGAGGGSGIFVNAFAHYLEISNNKIQSNQGRVIGGIRIGHQSLVDNTVNFGFGPTYKSAHNDHIWIHHNDVDENGGIGEPAAGGGIGIFNGSDDYRITENWICGNFTLVYGAGISHFGLSNNGLIENNKILFNEAFDEAGGIMLAGEQVPVGSDPNILTPGTGHVTVNRNLIQGNLAGDDGGGIRTLETNGQDVALNPGDNTAWWHFDILNNVIVNNVSADLGGGVSLDDSVSVSIVNNTIAYNDSTGTSEDAFGPTCQPFAAANGFCTPGAPAGAPARSSPQTAGVSARAHSARLQQALTTAGFPQTFANPILYNNIIWHNRSFYWDATINGGLGGLLPAVDNAGLGGFYWDIGVFGGTGAEKLDPRFCILDLNNQSLAANPAANQFSDNTVYPRFVAPYFNVLQGAAASPLGNFVSVTFLPLGLNGDYHIKGPNPPTDNTASPAIDRGQALGSIPVLGPLGVQTTTNLGLDIDGEVRPFDEPLVTNNPSDVDIGADEFRR